MFRFRNNFLSFITLFCFGLINHTVADSHNLKEILEIIQKDLKTLERAVYSETFSNLSR